MNFFSVFVFTCTLAFAYSETDGCHTQVKFMVTENPGKILTTYTTTEAAGVQNCASLCFKHPFCQAAGYSMVGSRPVCILSYGKETCSGGTYVTTAEAKAGDTLLLSCIKCPTDQESQTPLPSPTPVRTATSTSTGTNGTGTVGNVTNTKVETSVDGRISVAHCNDGNITTQEFAEIAGGITVSNASSTSQQQQTQPARTVTEGCSYNRYSNTGVKYLTGTTTGAPTSVGLITGEKSFLTESYCVQRCNAMEACTGVMYDINYMNNGFATCQLLSPPVQMFTYQPDPTKVDTSVTYIDNIQCGQQQTKYFCTYDMEPTTGLYPGFMYLANSNTYKVPSGHMCATMCYFATDCAFAIFEVNNHTCYMITHNSSEAVRGMSRTSPTPNPTEKILNATSNYYIFSNVSCPSQMYTGGIPKLNAAATCNHKSVEHVDPAKLLSIDLFPLAVLTTTETVQMCAAYCFYDSRCKSALFAGPDGTEALGKAVASAFMYHPATTRCVLMGFSYDDFMNVPIAGVAGLTDNYKGSNTGVTMLYDLKECGGNQRKTPCIAAVVNGTTSKTIPLPSQGVTPVTGSLQTFVYPVFGPSQCDEICAKMSVCKSALFLVDRFNFVCSLHDTEYPTSFNMTTEIPTTLARTKISC